MGLIDRLLGRRKGDEMVPLYNAIIARARQPHWFEEGQVPDTIDGRFDMIAAVLALVLLRMEEDPGAAEPSARLAERFIDDMDGQLREIGIGDIVVGKHVGKMMGMLGGRLGAFRDAFAEGGDLDGAVARNVYRSEAVEPGALAHVRQGLSDLRASLSFTPVPDLIAGRLP